MKKILLSCLLITAVIIACTSSRSKNLVLLKPDDVPADEYTIDTGKDTLLKTRNGAFLEIPKGSLQGGGNSVTLEIKEAYSMEQMIRAGLTTQSNGEPLSSGGMIYINAKGGQEVKITKAIRVAMPSSNLQAGMKLFKGGTGTDGNINWGEPSALPENPQLSKIERGRQIFLSKCANCHAIGKELSGPDLAHFPKRIPWSEGSSRLWSHYFKYRYTPISVDQDHKIDSLYADTYSDPYVCNLINMFGGKAIDLSDLFTSKKDTSGSTSDPFDVYDYIQSESDRNSLPYPRHAYLYDCADSCYKYKELLHNLTFQQQEAEDKKERFKTENGNRTIEERKQDTQPATTPVTPTAPVIDPVPPPVAPRSFDEVVSPENMETLYYQFTIESFGWYNVDMLIKAVDGNKESSLWVRVQGEYRKKAEVFLIIPSSRTYTKGAEMKGDPGRLVFAYNDGMIFLPQGVSAYILAIAENESSVAFSLRSFTTGTKQEFDLDLKPASKEEFNEAIKFFGTYGMDIRVKDTRNADAIRQTNREIKNLDSALKEAEKLRPKNCDCDCGIERYNAIPMSTESITAIHWK